MDINVYSDIDTKTAYVKEMNKRIEIIEKNITLIEKNKDLGIENSSLKDDIVGDTKQALSNLNKARDFLIEKRSVFR